MATLFGNASKMRRILLRRNGAQNIVKRYHTTEVIKCYSLCGETITHMLGAMC